MGTAKDSPYLQMNSLSYLRVSPIENIYEGRAVANGHAHTDAEVESLSIQFRPKKKKFPTEKTCLGCWKQLY